MNLVAFSYLHSCLSHLNVNFLWAEIKSLFSNLSQKRYLSPKYVPCTLPQSYSECDLRTVMVLFCLSFRDVINTEIEDRCLEMFVAIWQSKCMSVEARNKRFRLVFCVSFNFTFPILLTKALVCDGLKTKRSKTQLVLHHTEFCWLCSTNTGCSNLSKYTFAWLTFC